MAKIKTGWKILLKGNKSQHENFKWKKGVWYKHKGKLELCNSGFHASKELVSAMNYVTSRTIAKVEYRGEVIEQDDKFVASEMRVVETYRFTKRMGVEWSVYCARQSLKHWTAYDKTDKRPLKAIQAAEAWLKSTTEKNEEAARSAAEAAAEAARSAAESAAESAWSARSAVEAAWSAGSAAKSAAEAAARIKLHKKLLKIIKTSSRRRKENE